MAVYRLQAMMRFSDGRSGFAIDTINVEAADAADAVAYAQVWRPARSDLVSDALMLISPEGTVLWNHRRPALTD